MARQAGDPRVRYIAFHVESATAVDRRTLIETLRSAGERHLGARLDEVEPWLTRFDGRHGIVRCRHTGVDDARRLLEAIDQTAGRSPAPVRLVPVGTSGTIRALVERHLPELADRGGRGED